MDFIDNIFLFGRIIKENWLRMLLIPVTAVVIYTAFYIYSGTDFGVDFAFIDTILRTVILVCSILIYLQLQSFGAKLKAQYGTWNPLEIIHRILLAIIFIIWHWITKVLDLVGSGKSRKGDRRGKLRLRRGRRDGVLFLTEYEDERSAVQTERAKQDGLRKMKWRSLTSNRERVRFVYIAFLKKQMRLAGSTVNPIDTPNELLVKLQERDKKLDDALTNLYNLARYKDDEASITDQDLENVIHHAGAATRWPYFG